MASGSNFGPAHCERGLAAVARLTRLLVLCALGTTFATSAAAQTARTAAEALFREGRRASQQGDVVTACAKYRESFRLEAAVGTLLNLALCEADLGRLSDAWRHLQEVVHALPSDDRRLAIAREHLAALESRLPRLTLRLSPAAPPGTQLSLDRVALGAASLGSALPVDPGAHQIEVSAEGHQKRRYAVSLEERTRIVLDVEPGPAELAAPRTLAAAAQGPAAASIRGSGASDATAQAAPARTIVTYGLLGLSAGALVAAVGAGALVLDRLGVVHDHCDEAMTCDATGEAARLSGDDFYVAMLVSFGVCVAAGGTATYLLLSAPDSEAESASLRVAPLVSPDLWGARAVARY